MNTKLILLAVPAIILTGCASSTGTIPIDTSALTRTSDPAASETVFVRKVADKRVFEDYPKQANIPSTIPKNADVQDHAIGRKRNTWGKAMGHLVLPGHQTVTGLTRGAVEQAFIDNGYRVVTENEVTPETKIVDVSINRFWSWFNPGFWSIKVNGDMAAVLSVQDEQKTQLVVEGTQSNSGQVANGRAWTKVVNEAFAKFCEDARAKIGQYLKAK